MIKGKLFVISGPSGSGKTTIVKNVVKHLDNVDFSVSYTTRTRRENEVDGRDYKFISEPVFMDMVERGEFLEWENVYDNLYGTPLEDIKKSNDNGREVILDIDVKGAAQVRKNYKNAVFIFVLPTNMHELRSRLEKRKNETDIDIEMRLKNARDEVARIRNYDYIIINSNIDESTDKLASIIKAERCKKDTLIEYVYRSIDLFS